MKFRHAELVRSQVAMPPVAWNAPIVDGGMVLSMLRPLVSILVQVELLLAHMWNLTLLPPIAWSFPQLGPPIIATSPSIL